MPKKRTIEMIDTQIEFFARKRRKAWKKMNAAAQERDRQAEKINKLTAKLDSLQSEKTTISLANVKIPGMPG